MLTAVKKGMVVQYAQDYTLDFGGNIGKVILKAGTRAKIQAGGKKPTILAHAKVQDFDVNYKSPLEVVLKIFNVAEPVFTAGLENVVVKEREERSGEETRNFRFSLYLGKECIGEGKNDGYGGSNDLRFFGENGKKIENILKEQVELAKKNGIEGSDSTHFEYFAMESICEFFLDDFNGFMTIQDYLEFDA